MRDIEQLYSVSLQRGTWRSLEARGVFEAGKNGPVQDLFLFQDPKSLQGYEVSSKNKTRSQKRP